MTAKMTKETLLIRCLTGILHKEDHFHQVPDEDAKWIIERLGWHKVLPLAAALEDHHQKKCGRIEKAFRAATLNNLAREEHYHTQVTEIFNALDGAGLPYMPFKGPFWGHQLYPAYHWRHIGDIDILLSLPAAKAAAEIVTKLGYRADLLEDSLDKEFATRGELAFVPASDRNHAVPVELHWDVMPSPRFLRKHFLYTADFTEMALPGQWRGLTFNLPVPEIQLIYHLLHATCQHQFMRFVHVSNIVHFLQNFPELDWKTFSELVTQRQAGVPVFYGLKLANAFSPLPEDALKVMRAFKPNLLPGIFASLLTPGQIPLSTPQRGKMRRNLFRAAMSL